MPADPTSAGPRLAQREQPIRFEPVIFETMLVDIDDATEPERA